MADRAGQAGQVGRVAVLSGSWGRPHDEAAFAARAVAAAASRLAEVTVLVPGAPGPARADGAFDLVPVGRVAGHDGAAGAGAAHNGAAEPNNGAAGTVGTAGPDGAAGDGAAGTARPGGAAGAANGSGSGQGGQQGWPAPDEARWPDGGAFTLVVVDDADLGALALADRFLPGVPVAPIVSRVAGGDPVAGGHRRSPALAVGVGSDPAGPHEVGLHVPVHDLAAAQRHVGLGFSGYLLVLGDRPPADRSPAGNGLAGQAAAGQARGDGARDGGEACPAGDDRLTPLAAWLATRFADRHVVVVEHAVASVWRYRSLRGLVSVDTRTDLWRLVAHAGVTVDLAPGPLVARECIESLHYGVPIVVPAGGAAARLAARGGGLWYRGPAELLGCVEALDDPGLRDALGRQGRAVAATWYDDPERFVGRLTGALADCTGRPLPSR